MVSLQCQFYTMHFNNSALPPFRISVPCTMLNAVAGFQPVAWLMLMVRHCSGMSEPSTHMRCLRSQSPWAGKGQPPYGSRIHRRQRSHESPASLHGDTVAAIAVSSSGSTRFATGGSWKVMVQCTLPTQAGYQSAAHWIWFILEWLICCL